METYNIAHGCNYMIVTASDLEPILPLIAATKLPDYCFVGRSWEVPNAVELANFDCWATPDELEHLLQAITAQPITATVLCQTLRQTLN